MTTHDERAALSAGYALGSLTTDEREQYEAYLAESPTRRREADELAAVTRLLDADPPMATPPPDLRDRLMAQITVTPQHAPDTTDAAPASTPASSASPAMARARRRWYRAPLTRAVAAVVAALIVFSGGMLIGTTTRSPAAPPAAQAELLARLASAPDTARASAPIAGGGDATLVWSANLGRAAVVTTGLAPAPSGKTYQLWYVHGTTATSAGLLQADDRRSWKVLSGTMRRGDAVGITVEPTGGSKQPTTKPIAVLAP